MATYLEEAHDIPYVILESQINHPVCLVHAQILAAIKREAFLLQHVDQPSRGSHNDM